MTDGGPRRVILVGATTGPARTAARAGLALGLVVAVLGVLARLGGTGLPVGVAAGLLGLAMALAVLSAAVHTFTNAGLGVGLLPVCGVVLGATLASLVPLGWAGGSGGAAPADLLALALLLVGTGLAAGLLGLAGWWFRA